MLQLLGGWWKETLELLIWLHDFGATDVLRVLGILVCAHANARACWLEVVCSRFVEENVTAVLVSPIRAPRRETSFASVVDEPVSKSLSHQT